MVDLKCLIFFSLIVFSFSIEIRIDDAYQSDFEIPNSDTTYGTIPELALDTHSCPEREYWDVCMSHCQKNCSNKDEELICPMICKSGCKCNEGLVRDSDGKCIEPSRCPATTNHLFQTLDTHSCPEREYWDVCMSHCQKNCSNKDEELVCPMICKSGCKCNEGLVRDYDGKCIEPSRCPATTNYLFQTLDTHSCPEREYWDQCLSHCQKNCSNKDEELICPLICKSGCRCDEGLVRGSDGKCIEPSRCPATTNHLLQNGETECPRNERYVQCGAQPRCQRTCSNYNETVFCEFVCHGGCVCEKGLVRDSNGKCIPIDQCHFDEEHGERNDQELESVQNQFPMPILCKKNEIFSVCSSYCPDDCDNYKDTGRACNRICVPGCKCKKGLIKGPDGKCIKPEQCPRDVRPEDCTKYEYYDACGSSCPDDCINYNIPDRQCDKRCVIGCFCQPGYVKGPNGDCIFPFDCPAQQDSFPYESIREYTYSPGTFPYGVYPEQQNEHSDDESWLAKLYENPGSKVNKVKPSLSFNSLETEDLSVLTCPENEKYSECHAAWQCQKSCLNYDVSVICPVCVDGCVCEEGYVRESYPKGRCIKPEFCPAGLSSSFNINEEEESDCPDEKKCRENCSKNDFSFGMCIGPQFLECSCF